MADETETGLAPAEQTAAEKIAAKFGFTPHGSAMESEPAVETTETADTPADPESVEIDWEGTKIVVPKGLKDAFMRNEDYTKKTQSLAEEKRAIDHAREVMQRGMIDSNFNTSIEAESKELSVIDAYMAEVSKLNWSGMTTEQMLKQRMELDQIKERRDALRQSVEAKRTKYHEDVKTKLAELRAKSRELAAKSISGYSEQTEKDIRTYALSEGLSEAETDNVLLDPRSAKVLWKAMQYGRVQANAGKAAQATSKVVRPGGANTMPQEKVAELNFRKAMKAAVTPAQKATVIEQRLSGNSVFTRGIRQ